jgi:error-prone DNA polymerase
MSFVHLHLHTPFSFLDGASRIEELVEQAAALNMPALAVTDHNNLSGAVQFAQAARRAGIKAIQGAELTMTDNSHLTLLAQNADGYAGLCQLLTAAHLQNPRGQAMVQEHDLISLKDIIILSGCRQGAIARSILQGNYREARLKAETYLNWWGQEQFYIELQNLKLPGDIYLNRRLQELAAELGLETVAGNNVHLLIAVSKLIDFLSLTYLPIKSG